MHKARERWGLFFDDPYVSLQKIQDEIPSDPYEAEMVLLARASSESLQQTEKKEEEVEEEEDTEKDAGETLPVQTKVEAGDIAPVDNCNECTYNKVGQSLFQTKLQKAVPMKLCG